MSRLNEFQWTSQEKNGMGPGVGAERIHGGISVKITNGSSYMGFNLSNQRAFDLAAFISECVVAEMMLEGSEPNAAEKTIESDLSDNPNKNGVDRG